MLWKWIGNGYDSTGGSIVAGARGVTTCPGRATSPGPTATVVETGKRGGFWIGPVPPELATEQRAPAPRGRVTQGSGTVPAYRSRASFDPPRGEASSIET